MNNIKIAKRLNTNNPDTRPQKTFMEYIKPSSDKIADEIDAIANGPKSEVFWISCALTYAPTCALMVAYAQVDIINGQNRIFF